MNDGKMILIYRTNIVSERHRDSLSDLFGQLSGVEEWSVDLEDIDKVLRVVCKDAAGTDVAEAVRTLGFECEELE